MGINKSRSRELVMVCPLDSYYPLCTNCVPLRRPSPCYDGGASARHKSIESIGGYHDEALVFGGDLEYEIDPITGNKLFSGSIKAVSLTNKPFVVEPLKGKGKVVKPNRGTVHSPGSKNIK